MKEILAKKW